VLVTQALLIIATLVASQSSSLELQHKNELVKKPKQIATRSK
jgi:hypothetical protein